jgi:hypothetical protein
MQNASKLAGFIHVRSANCTLIPQSEHGLPVLNNNCDTGATAITPTHTSVRPPPHTGGLSSKQAQVFDLLIGIENRKTNYFTIGSALGLSKSSARDAVSQLSNKMYISKPTTIRDGIFQGFMYWVDPMKCQEFIAAGGFANEKYRIPTHTLTLSPHTVCSPSYLPDPSSSISSFMTGNELTAKSIDLGDPEMLYWIDQGLTAKQVKAWVEELKIAPATLLLSLQAARFDVVMNGKKSNAEPIKNPLNWIYKILKTSGIYQTPENYKSVLEIRADALEAQRQRDNIAKESIRNCEINAKFEEFMCDKQSALYGEFAACVTDFSRGYPSAFKREMKEQFQNRYRIENYFE